MAPVTQERAWVEPAVAGTGLLRGGAGMWGCQNFTDEEEAAACVVYVGGGKGGGSDVRRLVYAALQRYSYVQYGYLHQRAFD